MERRPRQNDMTDTARIRAIFNDDDTAVSDAQKRGSAGAPARRERVMRPSAGRPERPASERPSRTAPERPSRSASGRVATSERVARSSSERSARPTSERAATSRQSGSRQGTARTARAASERPAAARQSGARPSSERPARSSSAARSRSAAAAQAKRRKRRGNTRLAAMAAIAALVIAAVVVIIIIAANAGVKDVSKLKAEATESSIELSWSGASKKLSYDIYQKGPDDNDYKLVSTVPGTSGSKYTVSDLGSAEKYDFKVVSVKGEGEKAKKSEGALISAYTTPKQISQASAFTQNKDSLTVSFAAVDSAGDFELRYGESENLPEDPQVVFSESDLSVNPDDNTKNYMVSGLTEGNTYYFSIRSFAGEGNYSEWSPVFSGTVTRAVDMTGVDVNRPMVALTFDDGPDASDITWRILDALEAAGGKGTFFQLGQLAENMPDRMQRMVEGGHEIGSHTYDHEHMGSAVNENDIVHANDVIEQACGVRPTCFRSPGGETTDTIRQICVSEGMPLYYWTIDTRDWESRNADSVFNEVTSSVSDGDIILLHNIYDSSAAATERIVPWLVDQGYQLVTVSQLVQAKTGLPPEPGVQYYSGSDTN